MHGHLTDEEIAYFEEKDKDKRPIKLIVGLFVLMILIFSFIPYYVLKLDPNPNYEKINSIEVEELIPEVKGRVTNIESTSKIVSVRDYRILATKIASESCSWESDVCYAKALYYFVRDRVKYVSDPDKQYVQLPSETLMSKGGDCEDKAILLATLLEAIGLDADVGLTHDHAFVRVQLANALWRYKADEDYVYLDPVGDNTFGEISFKVEEINNFIEL